MIEGLYDIFAHWHKQGTVWIYSDTHFNDKELAAGVASRPIAGIHLANINSKVGKKDTFIHLGDVGDIEVARKIKGYKILIAGNHDAGLSNYKRVVHDFKLDAETYSKEQALEYAKKYGLKRLSGGDVHKADARLGTSGIAVDQPIHNTKELARVLHSGNYKLIINGEIE